MKFVTRANLTDVSLDAMELRRGINAQEGLIQSLLSAFILSVEIWGISRDFAH